MAEIPGCPVLFEDDSLIAFAKPAGLPVVPERWKRGAPDLMSFVHARLAPDWFNVHRLDRDTSGVLLCAKTKAAVRDLTQQFAAGKAEKRYLALVARAPARPSGQIDAPLAPDPRRAGRMRVSPGGKEAVSEYVVLERWRSGHALVEVRPRTGRQHQVRVHLAHLGCPIVGDPLYGEGQPLLLSQLKRGYRGDRSAEKPLVARLALHAESLTVRHPIARQPLRLRAELPRDLALALAMLRRHAA